MRENGTSMPPKGRKRGRVRVALVVAVAVAAGTLSIAGFAQVPETPALPAPPTPPDPQAQIAELQAVVAAIQANPAGAADILQAYATGEVNEVVAANLGTVLGLVSQVTAPVCPTVGTVAKLLPPLTINYGSTDVLGRLDKATSEALYQQYKALYERLLAPLLVLPPAVPGEVGGALSTVTDLASLVQTLVGGLLKINYRTTYYPPNGGDPIVRDTPGFLNLPMVLDVDGQVAANGYELCANTSFNLATGVVTQQISRMPLARATMPVDVKAEYSLLGAINMNWGYETKGSTAPYQFKTTTNIGASVMNTALASPGPTITQTGNLGLGTLIVENRLGSTAPPASYAFAATHPGFNPAQVTGRAQGVKVNYSAPTAGGAVDYTVKLLLGALTLGGGTTFTPSPTAVEWCNSNRGYCSNEPGIDPETLTSSTRLSSSQVVKVDQHPVVGTAACSTVSASAAGNTVPSGASHFTGQRLAWGVRVNTTTGGNGWIDSDGLPVTGCLSTNGIVGTLPTGFAANDRKATWSAGSSATAALLTIAGTISCPAGTTITNRSSILAAPFGLTRFWCPAP